MAIGAGLELLHPRNAIFDIDMQQLLPRGLTALIQLGDGSVKLGLFGGPGPSRPAPCVVHDQIEGVFDPPVRRRARRAGAEQAH